MRVMNAENSMKTGHFLVGLLLAAATVLADDTDAPAIQLDPDVVYGHKDGLALTMDLYRPPNRNGAAILFMVSGGWFSHWSPPERTQALLQPYLDKGYTMMAVRHGSSPRYSIPEAVADVRRAVRFVRLHADQFGVDPDRLGVLGMSAGGHLALMLGTTGDDGDPKAKDEVDRASSRVAAVVALVPPTDLRVAVWDAPESLPAYRSFPALNLPMAEAGAMSPVLQVTPDDAPSLVIMGEKDKLVPSAHGLWIRKAFLQSNVQSKLIIMPGAGHGLEGAKNWERLILEALEWYDKYLARPGLKP
jgi:acetyl esterase/lipase